MFIKNTRLQMTVVIVSIMAILGILYYVLKKHNNTEGFELPQSEQSMIPSDTPGSTVSDPTVSVPQPKDVQALLESAHNFRLLREKVDPATQNLSNAQIQMINNIYNSVDEHKLNTNVASMDVQTMSTMRKNIELASNVLRNSTQNNAQHVIQTTVDTYDKLKLLRQNIDPTFTQLSAEDISQINGLINDANEINLKRLLTHPETVNAGMLAQLAQKNTEMNGMITKLKHSTSATTVATKPGIISVNDLKKLQSRIQEEIKRLANLRSTSPTILAKTTQLTKLNADIGDILSSVERGKLSPEDIPIQADDATAFLKNIQNSQTATLITPTAQTGKKPLQMTPAHEQSQPDVRGMVGTPAIASLLQTAQYLKWNVQLNVEFDPAVQQREQLINRLESMEKRLTDLAVSETPVPKDAYTAYINELRTLRSQIGMPSDNKTVVRDRHIARSSNDADSEFSTPEYPSSAQQELVQTPTFPKGEISPDGYIRPGFMMNDETIARRASASAFDPRAVGGPDYKPRVQELCRQVQSAQLGDPQQFGCISNPDAVSANYSWKGNYEMVCNRLGDTWGGWYPEMFGCPKYNPSEKFLSSQKA